MVGTEVDTQQQLIIAAREEERRRLAHRWLDGPAQVLANLALHAEICAQLLERSPDDAKRELAELRRQLTESLQETRLFLYDVQPPGLADFDLATTLRRYLGLLQEGRGIETELVTNGDPIACDRETTINLFRAIQGPIDVAAARVGTSRLKIVLNWLAEKLEIVVEDDGRTVTRRFAGPERSSDIEEEAQARLAILGGQLITEPPGAMNRVRITVPLSQDPPTEAD